MHKIKGVLFDLDGTLLDTIEDLNDSLNIILEKNGFQCHTEQECKQMVGDGARNLVKRALPADSSEEVVDRMLAEYRSIYCKNATNKTRPYDGIVALLNELSSCGIKIGIVSNKPDRETKSLAKYFFPHIPLDCVSGNIDGIPHKPNPRIVLDTLYKMAIKAHECAFIGDSGVDMQTGVNSKLYSIGVLWGFRSKQELIENGANAIVQTPQELSQILFSYMPL